jgi:hypothetical protein
LENWKIGKININILYIGLLLPNGSFIPLLFDPLDKRGNSNTAERKSILTRFCDLWQQNGLQKGVFLADREFIGVEWFKAILDARFSLVIRLRITDYFKDLCQQHKREVEKMHQIIEKKVKKNGYFRSTIILDGMTLYYIVLPINVKKQRKTDEKFIVLISDNPNVSIVSQQYQLRWKSEVFFFNIKSNGFNVEDINLKQPEKIQLMLAILAFLYALIQKEHLNNNYNIKDKKFKLTTAKAVSIFRNSYDNFKLKVLNIKDLVEVILQNLDELILPNHNSFKNCKFLNLKSV